MIYRVLVQGQGLTLEFNGELGRYGFYTTRFVSAATGGDAGPAAVDLVAALPRLSGQHDARFSAVEVEEVDAVPGGADRGLAFYREDGVDSGDGIPLADLLPDFVNELEHLIRRSDSPHLADQVRALRVRGRCKCSDTFCATLYCRARPRGIQPESIDLNPESGMIIVDVWDGRVATIEILYRDEIRERLIEVFP